MNKFTLILAASVLIGFAAANTVRADHRTYGRSYNHGHSLPSHHGHNHHHHSHGGIYIQRGFGGYTGPYNAYRPSYSPYGIFGAPNYGYGCGPYYNPNGRVNGSFGIYFGF